MRSDQGDGSQLTWSIDARNHQGSSKMFFFYFDPTQMSKVAELPP
jgi:hypothetical protein